MASAVTEILNLIEEVSNEINEKIDKLIKRTVRPERVIVLIDHDNFRYVTRNKFKINYLKLKNFLLYNRIEIDTRLYCSKFNFKDDDEQTIIAKENREKFYNMLRFSGFSIFEKDLCFFEAEVCSDIVEMSKNPKIDTIVLVGGSPEYIQAIKRAKQNLVKIEVCFFRGETSTDLIKECNYFTDLSFHVEKLLRE